MSVVLYDDARARTFEPFALTRPASEMRAGALLVRRRWERALEMVASGVVVAPHLIEFEELGTPPVLQGDIPAGTVIANSRCAVTLDAIGAADAWRCDGRIAAVRLTKPLSIGELQAGALDIASLVDSGGKVPDVIGWWIDEVWDYIRFLPALLEHDIECLAEALELERGLHLTKMGDYPVYVERGARIDPFVVFDCQAGPVLVRRGASVAAFTRLVGPCVIGADAQVLGGKVTTSSIGESSRVMGEVSHTIFVGHANKAHEGFVGHSILGRWVNFGASTVTSNLKNTYGPVALWTPEGLRDTGLQFLGTLAGDHVKTAIGTRLTTGSVLGAGANVFGGGATPKVVAPFSWGDAGSETNELDRFLTVAERAMIRRDVVLTPRMRRTLERAYARRWTATP
ncbi:MAG: putative sugar nucleotidyl transferase [Gemmatimonadaceae bacterium]